MNRGGAPQTPWLNPILRIEVWLTISGILRLLNSWFTKKNIERLDFVEASRNFFIQRRLIFFLIKQHSLVLVLILIDFLEKYSSLWDLFGGILSSFRVWISRNKYVSCNWEQSQCWKVPSNREFKFFENTKRMKNILLLPTLHQLTFNFPNFLSKIRGRPLHTTFNSSSTLLLLSQHPTTVNAYFPQLDLHQVTAARVFSKAI